MIFYRTPWKSFEIHRLRLKNSLCDYWPLRPANRQTYSTRRLSPWLANTSQSLCGTTRLIRSSRFNVFYLLGNCIGVCKFLIYTGTASPNESCLFLIFYAKESTGRVIVSSRRFGCFSVGVQFCHWMCKHYTETGVVICSSKTIEHAF